MKTIPWGMATCLFHKFSCLKSKFVPLKTQKSEKNYDSSILLVCNFSLFIFFLHFVYSLLRTDEKCFLRSGNMFFHKFSCLKWKFRTVQNTKKHEKLTIFRFFWYVTFRFSFFSTFLYSLLRTDENCFLRSGNIFFISFHVLSENFVRYKTQKTWKINDFLISLVCNFSLFIFFLHFFIHC